MGVIIWNYKKCTSATPQRSHVKTFKDSQILDLILHCPKSILLPAIDIFPVGSSGT